MWDISLVVALILSLGLLFYPFGVHGINYLRVKRGMTWGQADIIFDNSFYSTDYKSIGNNQYKHYKLSGPLYFLIYLGGKMFNKDWDYSCSVGVRYVKQRVVDKVYEPFFE